MKILTKNFLAILGLIVTAFLFSPHLAVGVDHVVADDENIPCVLWCRGCSPTAGTMVLGYWDRGDVDFEGEGYGNLIDFWREYSMYSNGLGTMRNVPNILEELRIDMETNVSGGTSTGKIGSAIENTCNVRNEYNFESRQTYCRDSNNWCWEKITSEIDNNRPFIWSVGINNEVGHSLAAWGYTDDKFVITYNTWSCPGRDDWYYKQYDNGDDIDWGYVDTADPVGGTSGQTSLTWPDGGETLIAGKTYDILWYESGDQYNRADLEYSLDGGVTWQAIDTVETAGSGSRAYAWTVPDHRATKARVRIKSYSGSDDNWTLQAGDGSEANFSIEQDQTVPIPNPMTFSFSPQKIDTAKIEMSATTASDFFEPVEYFFDYHASTTGGAGGDDSGWQTSTDYIDDGLEPNHQYGYNVRARDGSPAQNTTSASDVYYEYTDIEFPTGISYGTITNSSIAVKSANTPSGLTRGNSGLWLECFLQGNSGWKQDNGDWIQTGLAVNTIYMFRAKARNGDAVETEFCDWGDGRYTLANVPGEAVISNATLTSMDVTINANGNPADTDCQIRGYDVGGESSFYLSTAGAKIPFEDGGQWQSILEWGTITATGLTPNTTYEFSVMARNGNGIITEWSASAEGKTQKRSITVNAPNGGEVWYTGESGTISWSSGHITGNVKIEISRDNAATWANVSDNIENTGTYTWSAALPVSENCRVRVTSLAYPDVSDTSDANFTIAGPVSSCTGDYNGDGDVDGQDLFNIPEGADLSIFAAEFGRTDCFKN